MTELPSTDELPAAEQAALEQAAEQATVEQPVAEQPVTEQTVTGQPAAPRPGVPVWRVGKPDAFLAAAVGAAREAVLTITAEANVGAHVAARSEGVRVVTHLFDCTMPGYVGWQWFATITRVSRSKDVTVNEVGLLPTNNSVLAPPWVPWAERVRPEDTQTEDAAADGAASDAAASVDAADDGRNGGEDSGTGEPVGEPAANPEDPESE